MNLDVVELAQRILKLFERAPISFARFCMLEQAFEELAAVAKLLDRDAQLVAVKRIELLQSLGLLDDLSRAAIKDVGCDGGDRL